MKHFIFCYSGKYPDGKETGPIMFAREAETREEAEKIVLAELEEMGVASITKERPMVFVRNPKK